MWPNPQETVDLVTFTEEILNEKLTFLCSDGKNVINYLLNSFTEHNYIMITAILQKLLPKWEEIVYSWNTT